MSGEHTRASIRLREAEARFGRRQAEQDGTVAAKKAFQAAKQELLTARLEYRATRPVHGTENNGSATARPETLRLKKTLLKGGG